MPDAEFLDVVRRAWNDHKTSQIMIRDILMYLNSVYVPTSNLPSVYDVGLMLFRDTVARAPEIKRRLLDLLLNEVARERNGEVVDRSVIKSATTMLVELGCGTRDVYASDFEAAYINATTAALRREVRRRAARQRDASHRV